MLPEGLGCASEVPFSFCAMPWNPKEGTVKCDGCNWQMNHSCRAIPDDQARLQEAGGYVANSSGNASSAPAACPVCLLYRNVKGIGDFHTNPWRGEHDMGWDPQRRVEKRNDFWHVEVAQVDSGPPGLPAHGQRGLEVEQELSRQPCEDTECRGDLVRCSTEPGSPSAMSYPQDSTQLMIIVCSWEHQFQQIMKEMKSVIRYVAREQAGGRWQ